MMQLMKNVGPTDRMIRFVLGIVLLALFFVLPAPVKYVGLLGIVALVTGAINFCPLYKLIGVNTCKVS